MIQISLIKIEKWKASLILTRAVLDIDVVELGLNSPEIPKIINGTYKAQKYLREILNERLIFQFLYAKILSFHRKMKEISHLIYRYPEPSYPVCTTQCSIEKFYHERKKESRKISLF